MTQRIVSVLFLISSLWLVSCTPTVNHSKRMDSNKTVHTILNRKSVRSYAKKLVEKEKVDTLLRAAMSAPTAVNKQPWAFVVIDNPQILEKLSTSLPYAKMAASAPMAIVVCGDLNKTLRGQDDPYWPLDCSAASENMLLAAESMGLGAVWTAVYPEKDRMEIVSEILSLPEYIVPFNLIPVGYPKHPEEPKDKFKEENIHYNQW